MTDKTYEQWITNFLSSGHIESLSNVPANIIDETLCSLAIRRDIGNLEHVPKSILNESLCYVAIKKTPYAIQDIPSDILTEDMCKLAVLNNSGVLKHVPRRYVTKSMVIDAINGAFEYTPNNKRNIVDSHDRTEKRINFIHKRGTTK